MSYSTELYEQICTVRAFSDRAGTQNDPAQIKDRRALGPSHCHHCLSPLWHGVAKHLSTRAYMPNSVAAQGDISTAERC